uniref:Uncharacterized protein n=1 Tax=Wuchereria bancrofti TaxID=6293 RepID=A0AAF5PZA4_WUCBA
MNGCIFIWIGSKNRLDTLCFAQNFRGMNLIESPKPNYLTDSFATKLNKLFPSKQCGDFELYCDFIKIGYKKIMVAYVGEAEGMSMKRKNKYVRKIRLDPHLYNWATTNRETAR